MACGGGVTGPIREVLVPIRGPGTPDADGLRLLMDDAKSSLRMPGVLLGVRCRLHPRQPETDCGRPGTGLRCSRQGHAVHVTVCYLLLVPSCGNAHAAAVRFPWAPAAPE